MQKKMVAQRGKRIFKPQRFLNFTKVIFRPISQLKLIGSWFVERSANCYSVLLRENLTVINTHWEPSLPNAPRLG